MEENTMRYNSSRNRIVRSLGVLVGAALVAALVLPSVAQAQIPPDTPVAPTVMYDMARDRLTVTMRSALEQDHSYLFFTLVDSDGVTIKRATLTANMAGALALNLAGSSDHGTWKANVRSANVEADEMTGVTRNTAGAVMVVDDDGVATGDYVKVPSSSTNRATAASPDRTYTHGPPAAPEAFGYNVPDCGRSPLLVEECAE